MKSLYKICASLGLVGAVAALVTTMQLPAAHAAAESATKNPMAAENVQRGEKVFASSCAFCHGATAKGGSTGPSLIDSALVRHDKDGDLIGQVVRDGRLEKGMPAFPIFNNDQISDVVAYLHARVATTDSRETAGPRSGYEMGQLLTGNAAAGKAYFDGQGGCTRCHSVTGDLAGVAKKYMPTELEGKILYPRGKASTAVVTLHDGKTFKGTLQHIDPFYVAITDEQGKYYSWNRDAVKVQVNDPLDGHLKLLGKYTNENVHDLFAYLETLK